MFLDPYHSRANGEITITDEQGSRFAKEVADDFNPIHNPDAQRFCVPGDLLFALVLMNYGVSATMTFTFCGMLGRDTALRMPPSDDEDIEICGTNGKTYLQVHREGQSTRDSALTEKLIRSYVAFSGHNFPHILIPLMAQHGVIINPDRPLVIYESMSLDLRHFQFTDPVLELTETHLEVNGRRGDARLCFHLKSGDEEIGTGSKKLVISGLREYSEEIVEVCLTRYAAFKEAYGASAAAEAKA